MSSYESIKKKYGLSSIEELNKSFPTNFDEEEKTDLVRTICKKMLSKLNFITKTLEGVIQPQQQYGRMQEASRMRLDKKNIAHQLYKESMHLQKSLLRHIIIFNEEKTAKEIKQSFPIFRNIEEEMTELLQEISEGWKRERRREDLGQYFG